MCGWKTSKQLPAPRQQGVLGKNRSKQMAFEHKASGKTKPSRQETPAMKKVEWDFSAAPGLLDHTSV